MKNLEYQPHNIRKGQKRILPIPHSFDSTGITWERDTDGSAFSEWLDSVQPDSRIAIDLETTGLDPFTSKITVIVLTLDGKNVLLLTDKALGNPEVIKSLGQILRDEQLQKVFHNAKFDMKFLCSHYGWEPLDARNIECTYVMRRLLVAGLDTPSSLDACSWDYLGYEMDKSIREEFIGATVLSPEMLEYAAIDGAATWNIYPILNKYLEIEETTQVYNLIEKPLVLVVADMELTGIGVDVEYLKTLETMLQAKIDERQAELDTLLTHLKVMPKYEHKLLVREKTPEQLEKGITHVIRYQPSLNVRSSKQVQTALNKLGLEVTNAKASTLEQPTYTPESLARGRKAIGRDLTDAEILKLCYETCGTIGELKKARTALGNFVQPLQSKFTNPVTGRIHCNFNQLGTSTGRFSHSEPNLAQMPKPDEEGIFGDLPLRRCFRLPEGYGFIVFDYDACELRILAEISKCQSLIENIALPDPHAANAAVIYQKPIEEVGKGTQERARAKNTMYLKTYGGGIRRLAAVSGITIEEAKAVYALFDRNMPEVKQWGDTVKWMAINKGYTASLSGRKRYYDVPFVSDVGRERHRIMLGDIERAAGNMPIQGTNADVTKLAMVWGAEAIRPYGGKLLITVHDELVAMAPLDTIEEASAALKKVMLEAEMEFLYNVECKVGGGHGTAWDH